MMAAARCQVLRPKSHLPSSSHRPRPPNPAIGPSTVWPASNHCQSHTHTHTYTHTTYPAPGPASCLVSLTPPHPPSPRTQQSEPV